MKEILFKNVGGEDPCIVQLVFNSRQDAIDFFASTINGFGNKDYSARFVVKKDDTLELRLKSKQNKTQAITLPGVKYNSNDFFIFTQVPRNKALFVIMCGTIVDNIFAAEKYKEFVYFEVSDYDTLTL